LHKNLHTVSSDRGYIFDISRFAIHDGPGIRTTVFFKGCPLRCWWCHNPESHKVLPEKFEGCNKRRGYNRQLAENNDDIGTEVSIEYLINEIKKDSIFYEESGGGVTFSGGEPLMQPKFLKSILAECKSNDLHTAVDTSGYLPWKSFKKIIDYTDMFLYDLKIMDSSLHEKYTGVPNDIILENLSKLDKSDKYYIVRIPIIPGINDTSKNIKSTIDFISSLQNVSGINLLPYHKAGDGKYKMYNRDNKLPVTESPRNNYMLELKQNFEQLPVTVKIGG
jgi:pyruvate formate lyase activating enzyme